MARSRLVIIPPATTRKTLSSVLADTDGWRLNKTRWDRVPADWRRLATRGPAGRREAGMYTYLVVADLVDDLAECFQAAQRPPRFVRQQERAAFRDV